MDVLMGLVAAICWGATDYLVSVNGRSLGIKRSVLYSQLLGLVVLSVFALQSSSLNSIVAVSVESMILCLVAAVLTLLGALSLAKALTEGRTAIVAPLVTSYGIVTTILAWAGGERLTAYQFIGIAICAFGVMAVGLGHSNPASRLNRREGQAIVFALLAAGFYGFSFWVQGKYALPAVGPINMLWLNYCVGALFLLLIYRDFQGGNNLTLKDCGNLSGASLFNLGGFAAFSCGVLEGSIAVVTVISTLSGGVAAMLGYMFSKERLTAGQLLGVSFVLLGAVVLHLL
ncbi:DMT family transporter [Pseudomonas sp. NMI542_15]|uniref:DMT family transporter n=1 Tax=Pseudomonas sp. NMI542_15 TaxID=2903148 RepID=UPI001E3D8B20|nr:DMT family transporter [Pseudomonas sp. NMI542_15]